MRFAIIWWSFSETSAAFLMLLILLWIYQFPVGLVTSLHSSSSWRISFFCSIQPNIHKNSQVLFMVTPFSSRYGWTSFRSTAYSWLHCSLKKLLLVFFIGCYSQSLHVIRKLCLQFYYMLYFRSLIKTSQVTLSMYVFIEVWVWLNALAQLAVVNLSPRAYFLFYWVAPFLHREEKQKKMKTMGTFPPH